MPVPRKKPTPLDVLAGIAEHNLPTISAIWGAVGGATLNVINEIRKLFNLVDTSEASFVYRHAKDFAHTPSGLNALGEALSVNIGTVPLDPNFRPPNRERARAMSVISFEIGGKYVSFTLVHDSSLTAYEIGEAVRDFMNDNINKYPFIEKSIRKEQSPADIRVRQSVRAW